jgi:hypothetical protein
LAAALGIETEAFAQPNSEVREDCSSAIPSAITRLPPLLDNWAKVECTRLGHRIVPNDGWVWRSFPSKSLHRIEAGLGGYFVSISYMPMTAAEKQTLIERFPRFALPKNLVGREVYVFAVSTNAGHKHSYMAIEPENGFGIMYDLAALPTENAVAIGSRAEVEKWKDNLLKKPSQGIGGAP